MRETSLLQFGISFQYSTHASYSDIKATFYSLKTSVWQERKKKGALSRLGAYGGLSAWLQLTTKFCPSVIKE